MADIEHYVREDVRGFLDMLEAMGGAGVDEVGHIEGREQMKALGAVAEAEPRPLAVIKDITCPGPAGDILSASWRQSGLYCIYCNFIGATPGFRANAH